MIRPLTAEEYPLLTSLARENDLEEPTAQDLENIQQAWGLFDSQGAPCGSVALFKRGANWVLDCLTVQGALRGDGWGKKLVETAEDFLRRQTLSTELFLVTKVPPFFSGLSYQVISREEAPDFSECFTCPRYQVSCFPQVMKKKILSG